MEQNQVHILNEKMEDLKRDRDVILFKKKRAQYADHLLDADKYEWKAEELEKQIENIRKQIQNLLTK